MIDAMEWSESSTRSIFPLSLRFLMLETVGLVPEGRETAEITIEGIPTSSHRSRFHILVFTRIADHNVKTFYNYGN